MLPLLAKLAQRHPRLGIDARLSDLYVDLVKEGVDVAIRTGLLPDSTLVARPFSSQQLLLFAAPAYIERFGAPATLADLSKHTAVLFRVPSTGKDRAWNLRSGGRDVTIMPPSRVRVDEGDAVVRAAVCGIGIGQVPHYMVTERLAARELVELLPGYRPAPMPIAAVIPTARMVPSRVRALLELISASPGAFPGPPPVPAGKTPRAQVRLPRRR